MLNLRNLRIGVEYHIFQKIELKFCEKNKDILPTQTLSHSNNRTYKRIQNSYKTCLPDLNLSLLCRERRSAQPIPILSRVCLSAFLRVQQHQLEEGKGLFTLNWGFVERVDLIPCGYTSAPTFLCRGRWNMRDGRQGTHLPLYKTVRVKVVYDEPWFWKLSISSSKKPDEAPKPKARPTVTFGRRQTIDLDDSNVTDRSAERKKARKLRIARKNKQSGPNRNDPIVARALENSPTSAQKQFNKAVNEGQVTAEELANVPTALRHFDDSEDQIEEGQVVEAST